jgi:hypothetical protein
MTIHCSKCREAFSSLLVPQTKALEELGNKLATHCATKHQGDIRKLNEDGGKMGAIAMWLMLLRRFAAVPQSETFIYGEIDKHANEVLEILGFEVKEVKSESIPANPAD